MTKAWPDMPFEGNDNWGYLGSTQNIDVWRNIKAKEAFAQYRVQYGPSTMDFQIFTSSFLKLTYLADQIDRRYPWMDELVTMVELSK